MHAVQSACFVFMCANTSGVNLCLTQEQRLFRINSAIRFFPTH